MMLLRIGQPPPQREIYSKLSAVQIFKKKTNFVLFSSLKGISYQVQVHLTVQFTKVLYVSPIPSPAFCFFLFPYLDTIFLQSRLSIVFLLLTVRTAVQSLKILTKFLTVKIQVTTSKIQSDLCFLSWNTLKSPGTLRDSLLHVHSRHFKKEILCRCWLHVLLKNPNTLDFLQGYILENFHHSSSAVWTMGTQGSPEFSCKGPMDFNSARHLPIVSNLVLWDSSSKM